MILSNSVGKESMIVDFELIEKTLKGDNSAFDKLVLKYEDRIFNIAYRMMGSYEEAKDASQEAFVNTFRSLANFRKESSFYTYLCQILINVCKNKFKRLNRDSRLVPMDDPFPTEDGEVRLEIPDNTYSPRDAMEKKDKEARVQEAINALDEEHKAVVVLRDIEGASYEEIALALNLNIGTIKSRLHRARQELKNKLKDVI